MKTTFSVFKCGLFFLGSIFFTTLLAATPSTLKTIRVTESPGTASVVLEFSHSVEYKTFQLHGPERYVIDLSGVKFSAALPQGDLPSPISGLRASEDGDRVRVVIDLEQNVKPQVTAQAGGGKVPSKLTVAISRQGMRAASVTVTKLSALSQKIAEHARATDHPSGLTITGDSLNTLAKAKRGQTLGLGEIPKPSAVRSPVARDVVVVIDPGHGGKDPGARGSTGTLEKDVVLAIAKKLQAQINRQPGFRAVLTRKGDYYIGLRQRLALARQHQGDMFIAIHADAHEHVNACGVGVYALSQRGATSEAARWLAQQENQSEFVGGLDLADKDQLLRSVLIDLSQTQSITASLQMGSALLQNLGQFAQLHHSTVEQAAFVVLKSPDIPSLLVETGFISNALEERRLSSAFYQERIAVALLGGIKNYFITHPPRGSRLALNLNKDYDA